jgi:hypothetical protein
MIITESKDMIREDAQLVLRIGFKLMLAMLLANNLVLVHKHGDHGKLK